MRVAMWSGPRNLSTAMMYAFAARGDFAVVDEPFYAAYLCATGLTHPMGDELKLSQDESSVKVIASLSGSIPGGMEHFYQKHMTQHMIPQIDREWMMSVKNVFLIRHPARVVASYLKKREMPDLDELGFRQQAELFDYVRNSGKRAVVIDSTDIRAKPAAAIRALCGAIGLEFKPEMLNWPKGGRPEDGVWASHWYGAVHQSTGFAGREDKIPDLSGAGAALAKDAMPYYEKMLESAIKPEA